MRPAKFYRLPEIKRFVAETGGSPIRVIIDVGANVGVTLLALRRYFPAARIVGFEAVDKYFAIAVRRTARFPGIEVENKAVTGVHLFFDDLGERPRPAPIGLAVAMALPESGSGWEGGSIVGPLDHEAVVGGLDIPGYRLLPQSPAPITLDQVVAKYAADDIDLLKLDCEGSESSILGSASRETLGRVRFITGEYHGLSRFYRAARHRLFSTHRVFFSGGKDLGSFFAERRDGAAPGILSDEIVAASFGLDAAEPIQFNPMRERPAWLRGWRLRA